MSTMMTPYLPQSDGFLPYYLLYGSFAAFVHSLVCYTRPQKALPQFSGPKAPQPTTLLAHIYATHNIYTGLIRFQAAYSTNNEVLYSLAIWTYVGVLSLYASELLIWKTVRPQEAVIPPVTAVLGISWMLGQREWYLQE